MASTTDAAVEADKAAFLAELKAFEGQAIGTLVGPDPVNQAMIRHWVEAMGDTNPVYTDPVAAAASVHGQVIAPAVMLQAWTMQGIHGPRRDPDDAQARLLELLEGAGYTGVVAVNCEQEYARMLHLGDHLQSRSIIESISEEKQTALGAGHFVTTRIDYLTLDGELVGRQMFRILKFKPGTGRATGPRPDGSTRAVSPPGDASGAAARPRRPRPAITHDNAFLFDGFRRHELLIQQCASCRRLRHPPQPRCDLCGSYDWDTVTASGHGTVYSYVVNHAPQVPAFEYPLPIALVELEEGTRIVADLVEVDLDAIVVGMPVELVWLDCDEELSLPAFRPERAPRDGDAPGSGGAAA